MRWHLAAMILLAAPDPSGATPVFEDVTEAFGIDPVHASAFHSSAGVAVFDWDGDGWSDLFIAGGNSANALLRSLGPPSYGFEDVTWQAGIYGTAFDTRAVVAKDLTGDGRTDLFLLAQEPVLFVGRADGTFVNESPVRLRMPAGAYASGAAADFDGDGDLDLALTRGDTTGLPEETSDCLETHFFENRGVLTWVPELTVPGCGLVGALTDLDDDGDVDWIQGNDFGALFVPTTMILNGGAGFDPDATSLSGLDSAVHGMGIAVGDVDGDLRRDVFITSFGEDALLLGSADGSFNDVTDLWRAGSTWGESLLRVKWGAVFFDADNDGDEDLAVAAGGLPTTFGLGDAVQRSILLENTGAPPFLEVSHTAGLDVTDNARTIVAFDADRDGGLDLLVGSLDSTRLLRNTASKRGHWVSVKLRGTVSNTDAVGARILVTACGRQWVRELTGGGVPGGTVEPIAHVGIGPCTEPATVDVRWPSGHEQTVSWVPSDTSISVIEPEWLSVVPRAAPADGVTPVVIRYEPPTATPESVAWTATLGTPSAAVLLPVAGGAYEATLIAPTEPGEATVSLTVDGKALHARPRVRFVASEAVDWGLYPARPTRARPVRIGASLVDETVTGEVGLEVTGGNVSGQVGVQRAAWATVHLDATATELVAQATLGGAPYGEPFVVAIHARVDAVRSKFQVQFAQSDGVEPLRLAIAPRDATGAASPVDGAGLPVTLLHDGVPLQKQPAFIVAEGHLVAEASLDELGGAGTLSAIVDSVPLAQTAQLAHRGESPLFAALSPERSTFRFFSRHLHADGEEVVTIVAMLKDSNGQDLPPVVPPVVELTGQGCEPLSETWLPVNVKHPIYMVHVRAGTGGGVARVSLSLEGVPTGLEATALLMSPAPNRPDMDASAIQVVGDGGSRTPAGDGAALTVRVHPRDASGNFTGSGIGVQIATDGGTLGPVAYDGAGGYAATLAPPAEPCTATVTATFDGVPGVKTAMARFTQADGTAVDTVCAPEVEVEPVPIPAPDNSSAGCAAAPEGAGPPSPWVTLLLVAMLFRLARRLGNGFDAGGAVGAKGTKRGVNHERKDD